MICDLDYSHSLLRQPLSLSFQFLLYASLTLSFVNSKLWFCDTPSAHCFTGIITTHFRHIGIMSEVCFYVLFCQSLSYPWLFTPIRLLAFLHPAVSSSLWVSLFLYSLSETFFSPHIALQYPFIFSLSAQVVCLPASSLSVCVGCFSVFWELPWTPLSSHIPCYALPSTEARGECILLITASPVPM